jgi:hypothetical protein
VGWRAVLSGECPIVHEEEVDIIDVVHEKCLMTRGHQMPRLLICPVSNLRLGGSVISIFS